MVIAGQSIPGSVSDKYKEFKPLLVDSNCINPRNVSRSNNINWVQKDTEVAHFMRSEANNSTRTGADMQQNRERTAAGNFLQ